MLYDFLIKSLWHHNTCRHCLEQIKDHYKNKDISKEKQKHKQRKMKTLAKKNKNMMIIVLKNFQKTRNFSLARSTQPKLSTWMGVREYKYTM